MDSNWLNITEGQVIRAPSGRLRVVREVHRNPAKKNSVEGRRVFVYLTIGHPSWTNRAYTVYSVAELAGVGYMVTKAKVNFKNGFQKKFRECIGTLDYPMTAKEVVGIP